MSPPAFRAALTGVPESERDGWVDRVFGLEELPEDSSELPRGCVPYLPCSVNTLLRMVELADVRSGDVFVDIGSGLGRATTLTHLLTGAGAIGVEIQSALVRSARELATRLNLPRVTTIEGDAAKFSGYIATGSVFFLYAPFGGDRVNQFLDDIEWMAKIRRVRVCSVSSPLPSRSWLTPVGFADDLTVYRSQS